VPGLLEEDRLFRSTLSEPETRALLARFMEAGGQTREVELDGFPL
jgi:hypothetical protein